MADKARFSYLHTTFFTENIVPGMRWKRGCGVSYRPGVFYRIECLAPRKFVPKMALGMRRYGKLAW